MSAKYSDDKRALTLAYYEANGRNQARTARDCTVPRATLQKWLRGEGISEDAARKVAPKKAELDAAFERLARKALGLLLDDDAKLEEAGARDLTIIAATATDKMRLLRGEATGSEDRTIRIEYADSPSSTTASGSGNDHPGGGAV